jgi:F0F1-type ATP synthase assembly protein I
MATKPKVNTSSRTKFGSKPKSKISNKLIAAIIIGIVAIAGIAIVFSSFASGPPAYQYSYNTACTADKKTTTVKTAVTIGFAISSRLVSGFMAAPFC